MKFTEILSEYNIPIAPEGHHHARPGWVQFDCPFCGLDSKKFHMGYSLEGNYINCWQCGSHPLITTLMELTRLSFHKCKTLLDDLEISQFKKEKVIGKLILPKGIGKLLPAHIKYLKSRGFNYKELQRLWRIQGIGISSRLSWRIFIPIIYQDQIVSWTTRSISNQTTRYISALPIEESIHHKNLLYGEDYARHSIIITEGPADVWKIGPGAVATFGTGYSQAQVNRMSYYSTRVICFDNNSTAQKQARKLCDDLSVFPGETFNIVLDSKDPGSASKKEIRKIRREFLK